MTFFHSFFYWMLLVSKLGKYRLTHFSSLSLSLSLSLALSIYTFFLFAIWSSSSSSLCETTCVWKQSTLLTDIANWELFHFFFLFFFLFHSFICHCTALNYFTIFVRSAMCFLSFLLKILYECTIWINVCLLMTISMLLVMIVWMCDRWIIKW